MKQKMVKLAKQAAKLLWIELVVPGGTLVVLAILLARGPASWMSSRLAAPPLVQITGERPAISSSSGGAQLHKEGGKNMTRTVMIVGLISALVLSLWGAALSVAPAWAEVKASESEVLALKQEVATSRAELQKLSAGTGAEAKRIDLPVTPDCASRPDALLVIEAALGLCK
jgi:hypothetical protein